jgi:hypothetical protein
VPVTQTFLVFRRRGIVRRGFIWSFHFKIVDFIWREHNIYLRTNKMFLYWAWQINKSFVEEEKVLTAEDSEKNLHNPELNACLGWNFSLSPNFTMCFSRLSWTPWVEIEILLSIPRPRISSFNIDSHDEYLLCTLLLPTKKLHDFLLFPDNFRLVMTTILFFFLSIQIQSIDLMI